MKPALAALAAAALLSFAAPPPAAATDSGLANADISAAKRSKYRYRTQRPRVYVPAPGRRAFGYRNDPSFDPYGRPWRPNFYAPCYEDLGYGRFRDCAAIR